MNIGISSNAENAPDSVEMEEGYDPAYYRDLERCFVPSCRKYRRDYPDLIFLSIPKSLQETWCRAVARHCPKRKLYVCKEHVNMQEDCYKTKAGKWRLKQTANLILAETYDVNVSFDIEANVMDISNNLAATSSKDLKFKSDSHSKSDFSTQTQDIILASNKAVSAKPMMKSVGCSVNFNIKATDESEKTTRTTIIFSHQELPSSTTPSKSSTPTLYEPPSPSISSTNEFVMKENMSGRSHILTLIKENPKMYIGVPSQYYWFVDYLSRQCKLRSLHIIVTLFKIRQNDSIKRICHHFSLSQVTVQEILNICIPRLATHLQDNIYLPEPILIKKTLPAVYKPRYANVQCIIDCFEIEIEKPSNPLFQSRTWSQYKSCNTLKYLIAICPNGFICFISRGYGGSISDKAITVRSGFADILPPGAMVLADRGFKAIENVLQQKHAKLLCPPSVSAKKTPTKLEVIKTKIIASLRIHVERVIRRLREFNFLKPHSVINHNHLRYVDECVIIACALVNLQSNIIKTQ